MLLAILVLLLAALAFGWSPPKLHSPGALTASVDDRHNDLVWDEVAGASRYLVLRAAAGGDGYRPIGLTREPGFVDPIGRREAGEYDYAIVAMHGVWPGHRSQPVRATDVAITAPVKADEDRTIVASTGEVSLYIPAGTFGEDTTVTITELQRPTAGPDQGTEFMTGAYDFGPEGSLFADMRPRITLAYEVAGAGEDFERDWVGQTARIFYRSPDGGAWSDASRGLLADATSDTISGELDHFSTYASGYTVMPHGRYLSFGSRCDSCHDVHVAEGDSLTRRAGLELCYYCHGGAMAADGAAGAHGANVQAEFLSSADQTVTAGDSVHPVHDGRMDCGDCHNPHLDPSVNPRLLFAWESDGTRTRVADGDGALGNAFCFGCHGGFDNLEVNDSYYSASGGDHETIYSGPHATFAYAPPATNDTTCSITPANGSGVQCLVCHQRHGTAGADYLNAYALGAGADRQALCYECHQSAAGADATWNDRHIPDEFARASVHDITGATGAQLTCANCHNSHSVQAGGAGGWNMTRASDPDDITGAISDPGTFCLRCHDGGAPTRQITASVLVPYAVSFPDWGAAPFFTGFDKTDMTTSGHWDSHGQQGALFQFDAAARCDSCHDPHGSDNARLTAFTPGHSVNPGRNNSRLYGEERLCYGCHDWAGSSCSLSNCHEYMPNIGPQMSKTAGTYSDWTTVNVSAAPSIVYAVESGVVDGDGTVDLAEGSTTLRWFDNNGTGTAWTASVVQTVAANPVRSIAVGELGGTISADIASVRAGGQVYVHHNTNALGTAWTNTYIGAAGTSGGRAIAMGDLDGDGDADLVTAGVSGTAGSVRVWLNPQPTVVPWSMTEVATPAVSANTASLDDIDGDGSLDIVYGGGDRCVTALLNAAGDGSTWTPVTIWGPASPVLDVTTGDVDGDGDVDIVSGVGWFDNANQYGVVVHENQGGTWSAVRVYADADVNSVALGDMDEDGYLDIGATMGNKVVRIRGFGSASGWASRVTVASLTNVGYAVGAADFDGDGDADLVSGQWGNGAATTTRAHLATLNEPMPRPGPHPTNAFAGRHTSMEEAEDFGTGNRHAECVDCHDAHLVERGTHTMGTNLASGSISGSIGVAPPGTRTAWTSVAGSAYAVGTITYEYELCYKCHSSYTTGYTGEDKAKELNAANVATHPVEGTAANLGVKDGSFTLGTPWNLMAADEDDYSALSPKMTCTDCHGSETATDPKGPHGSTIAHVLRGTASTVWAGDRTESTLCLTCHHPDVYTYVGAAVGGGASIAALESPESRINHRHFYNRGATCLECHYEHGSNTPHLIKGAYTHATGGGTWRDFSVCGGISGCHGAGWKTYTANY